MGLHMDDVINIFARGLNRESAARYIGVGASLFDQMVADGRMPQPKVINSRRVWDKKRLDEFFEALPEKDSEEENPFNGVMV